MQELDLLILGAGWTATFLIPLARERGLKLAATTRDGRDVGGAETIKWTFDPESKDESQFSKLPLAKNIIITFPLNGKGQSKAVVHGYEQVWKHKASSGLHFLQLGSTGIWQIPQATYWTDRHSPFNTTNSRAIAEEELLGLGGSVLNLSGLWGGPRDPRTYVDLVARTKEDVKGKTCVHFIHGLDVSRSILAMTAKWSAAKGERWMLTDGLVYDWWELFARWADVPNKDSDPTPSKQSRWMYELMSEEGVKALPRSMETLGRCYDTREFWNTFELSPVRAGAP